MVNANGPAVVTFLVRFSALVVCVAAAWPATAAELRAGAAKVDITPPPGHPMWGYAARHDRPCVGVLDPLHARAVVLEVGPQRLAVVSLDLGRAPTRASLAEIRKQVKERAKVGTLFLVASHTHHGPVLEVEGWPDKGKPYSRDLEHKLTDVIARAAENLRPARLGVAARHVPFNRNRHSRLPNPPVDDELVVVRLEDAAGKPLAHLVNFAAHPTMHPTELYKFSADFPGALAGLVEKETGVPCLFLQGAAGDLSPNPGEHRGPDAFGRALGREVLALANGLRCTAGADTTLAAREREFRFGARLDLSNPLIKTAFSVAFFPGIVDFYEREYRDGVRPRTAVAVLDGRVGLVGASGEFFCEHALGLKKRARLDHLLFLGYCNDYQQYFPTIQAAAEGGYGADPQVALVDVGAGEQLMNRALADLYELRGRLRP